MDMRSVTVLRVALWMIAMANFARSQDLMVESFNHTGELTFNQVSNAAQYRVEWAPAPDGPWNTFTGAAELDSLVPTNAGSITVSVPMCYRVVAVVETPLVINEIDYDQPGTDQYEFVEIFNTSDKPVALAPYRLEFVNGNGSVVYATVQLADAGSQLPGYGYLVVGSLDLLATVTNTPTIQISAATLQNGPDGVRLVLQDETFVDGIAYEGELPGVGEGTPVGEDDSSITASWQRIPNGSDTDDNATDFALITLPTPGRTNAIP